MREMGMNRQAVLKEAMTQPEVLLHPAVLALLGLCIGSFLNVVVG